MGRLEMEQEAVDWVAEAGRGPAISIRLAKRKPVNQLGGAAHDAIDRLGETKRVSVDRLAEVEQRPVDCLAEAAGKPANRSGGAVRPFDWLRGMERGPVNRPGKEEQGPAF